MEQMEYFEKWRDIGQMAAEIQIRLPVQLRAGCDAAGRAERARPSDSHSPFQPRPNYTVPSKLYSPPASARSATARRGRKLSSVLAVLLFAASGTAQAATINARSPSLADVSTAVAAAVQGDTVVIPAGTATWTSPLTISKRIHLKGMTTVNSLAGTANDQTIIQDAGTTLIKVQSTAAAGDPVCEVSNLTFKPNSTSGPESGMVQLSGNSRAVRVDNCHFISTNATTRVYTFVAIEQAVRGVVDHCVMEFFTLPYHYSIIFHHPTWPNADGSAANSGNGAYNSPTNLGGPDCFFVEDCYLKNTTTQVLNGCTDDKVGARWCWRHNHMYDVMLQTHGTEGGLVRGGRQQEVYNNDFHHTFQHTMGGVRTGTLISHDNTVSGVKPTHTFTGESYRCMNWYSNGTPMTQGFCGASGDNPWDVNDVSNGTVSPGQTLATSVAMPDTFKNGNFTYQNVVNGLYFSGSVASNGVTSGGTTTLTVANSPGWATNQWVGFVMHRTALASGAPNDHKMSLIMGNSGANGAVFSVNYYLSTGSGVTWSAGDKFEIHRPLITLDQPGRGECKDKVAQAGSANYSINQTTGKPSWPHQLLEPWVCWNDRHTDGSYLTFGISPVNAHVLKEGRDVINGGATMPNTPTLTGYKTYTYPHPLTTGLAPPSNLTIVP